MSTISLQHLRRHAIARSLFAPMSLPAAIDRLGFVQADPIRAPARAQDLILRHRVLDYGAGDLERLYPSLPIDEEFFVNYGFLPHRHAQALHPRKTRVRRGSTRHQRIEDLLAFVRSKSEVHPREAAAHFAHGRVKNYWGGASSATTQLLDLMHFQGKLRVSRRDNGIRVYSVRDPSECTGSTPPRQRSRRRTAVAAHRTIVCAAACANSRAAHEHAARFSTAPVARNYARAGKGQTDLFAQCGHRGHALVLAGG